MRDETQADFLSWRRQSFPAKAGLTMAKFRVVDLRPGSDEREHEVTARSPKEAAEQVIGEKTVRGQRGTNDLLCRVYWQETRDTMNMVRLFRPAGKK
ncbi:hypothetical protein [Devosia riboflavina]